MKGGHKKGIGISYKTGPPFGTSSDPIVTPGPQRFSQNWGSDGRGLAHMGKFYTITGESGVVNTFPYRVKKFSSGRYFKRSGVVTSKPSKGDQKCTRYLYFCVRQ